MVIANVKPLEGLCDELFILIIFHLVRQLNFLHVNCCNLEISDRFVNKCGMNWEIIGSISVINGHYLAIRIEQCII